MVDRISGWSRLAKPTHHTNHHIPQAEKANEALRGVSLSDEGITVAAGCHLRVRSFTRFKAARHLNLLLSLGEGVFLSLVPSPTPGAPQGHYALPGHRVS